jgi:hypothetical protein
MKQYVIDELRPQDYRKLKTYLDDSFGSSVIGGIYWIALEDRILTEVQSAHDGCQPHYFAVDLSEDRLACELLVRTQARMRCNCMGYATETQRNWLIRLIDAMFEELEIKT